MITSAALVHGDVPHHLDFDPAEHPLALQLGGSDPAVLAHGAKLGERWGYDEINLNCGCPSERVQKGSFGACLMAEPALVADCVKAMRDAVALPVTVKHRIGLDDGDDYGFVRDFVGTVAAAGCEVFIVHARNAVLKGLSPKENREVPPLRYDVVHRLKRDFPALTIVINGGLADWDAIERELVDGRRRDARARSPITIRMSWRRPTGACSATTRPRARAPTCCARSFRMRRAAARAACRCARSRGTCSASITAVRAAGASGGSSPMRRGCATRVRSCLLEALAAVEPVEALPA